MPRWMKRTLWLLSGAIATPLLAASLLYLLSDTGPGRWAISGLISLFSDVTITELDGSFPNALRARHVEVADSEGVWLQLDDVAIDGDAWGWFSDNIKLDKVRAGHASILRLPVSDKSAPATLRFDIKSAVIERADFARALTGHAISIAVSAHGHYTNESDTHWTIDAKQLGGSGTYHSTGNIDANRFIATLSAREPNHGLIESLAGLPDLGALAIDARIYGPRTAENIDANVQAGPTKLRAFGGIDLTRRTLALDVSAHGPAMAPRHDLAWDGVDFDGHVRGSFDAPEASGRLAVKNLNVSGGGARTILGELSGSGGAVRFTGAADGVRIPGREPYVLGSAPLKLTADLHLGGKDPLAHFHGSHPMVALDGRAIFGDHLLLNASLNLARVAPFANLAGVELDGRAALTVAVDSGPDSDAYDVAGTVDGSGAALLSRLMARGTHVAVHFRMARNGDFAIDKANVAGAGLKLDASGAQKDGGLDFTWKAELPDVSRVVPSLRGRLAGQGRMQGPQKTFAVSATGNGALATQGYEQGPLTFTLNAQGVPDRIAGSLSLQGRLDAAPLRLEAAFDPRGNGVTHIALKTLDWRSAHAVGDFVLPRNARGLTGSSDIHIGQLADIGVLIGQTLKGAAQGRITITGDGARTMSDVHITANGFAVAGVTSNTMAIDGRIADPLGTPDAALTVKTGGLVVAGFTGNADAKVNGPLAALRVAMTAQVKDGDSVFPLGADATVDTDRKTAVLERLQTTYRGEPFALTAPAHIDFANGLAVDQLRLASNSAEIRIAGRITPQLAADISLRNASPELMRVFVPSLDAEGTLSGDAKLSGTVDAPGGSFTASATGFRLHGQASGLPPATITASGTLHGTSVSLSARIDAGKAAHMTLVGTAPLSANGQYDIKAVGTLDLTVTDPVLAANGRRLRGIIALDGRFTGNFDNPRASGSAVLTGGEVDDFLRGIRITNLAATIEAKGDTVSISKLSGRAGAGTVSGFGTIALWADGIPLDLTITLVNAKPLATDQFTAVLDANLKVGGNLRDRMTLSGTARINQGEINIAESFPPEVGELDVRRSRDAPPPKAAPPRTAVGLDLSVTAPGRIFVRGRGLDAEVGGTLTVKGTSIAPVVSGGFTMRRGELSLAGQILRFTSGKITFDGQSINGSTDPALDFAAESTSGSVTAKLAITGHASAPRIALSSSPTLPQDEVLSHLLFSRSVSQLSPLELAQIAEAFAQLGGLSGGFNPLGSLRKSLGLDRLAVGTSASGNGATIEVGKTFGGNIYVGAKQDTSGGTQAIVQVDLTEHLKLQSTVTAVASAQPSTGAVKTDQGSSVGLSYQFEY